tara:strand:- start:11 stop:3478 length:3468 start_codon:yes stop_codon:yes gene_type:complete
MSELILSQLKSKPKPSRREENMILVKLEKKDPALKDTPVALNIPIKNKVEEFLIDRSKILEKIKPAPSNLRKTETKTETKIKTDKLIGSDAKTDSENTAITKIKKTKKLKLVTIDGDTDKLPDKPRETKKPTETIISGPKSLLDIKEITDKLPDADEKIIIKAPVYYQNNREIFINFINGLFDPYKKEIEENLENYSCDKSNDGDFQLLFHQKIVRDYLNLYTPYRGLLLYHGLGSGKTCSSIAIAEGFKSEKQIFVMTPASLRINYIEELKKCGDLMYRKTQYWEFVNIKDKPELIEPLSSTLNLSTKFIKDNNVVWFVNIKEKKSNYNLLNVEEKNSLDKQLDEMIKNKFKFINYNGIRNSHLNALTLNNTINPFSNSVIIIDEAHNFVSRIVNKIQKQKKGDLSLSLSTKLYDLLMRAENARIVLLSGTPIINYPNEIGITMNILRGKIKIWKMKLSINEERKLSQETITKIFKSYSITNNIIDYIEYRATSSTLIITRNPFGFFSLKNEGDNYKNYNGILAGADGNIDDDTFLKLITKVLEKNRIKIVSGSLDIELFNCLPDNLDDFAEYFIEGSDKKRTTIPKVRNMNLFKRRIIGLTSYFPDIESLLPSYQKEKDFYIKKIPMSQFQFMIYEEARVQERKLEMNNSKRKKGGNEMYEESVSTYRIFSRAFCNFVFPRPDITRPLPNDGKELSSVINETVDFEFDTEGIKDETQLEYENELNDIASEFSDDKEEREEREEREGRESKELSYPERIKVALKKLEDEKDKYLTPDALKMYSPKFLNILDNIKDPSYVGLHLMYSQFRTLEGIGIFSLVLKSNGFAQFKLKKDGEWKIDIPLEDRGKPTFVLYTGTETSEEKEIIRNIFNGDWEMIPKSLREELEKISSNNNFGEIIKVIMITASGAEGISLKNVRWVHLTDPYWHPVRLEQVIGRARRICSHKDLPPELRTVKVFLYLMTFSDEQLSSDLYKELRLKDKSKLDYYKNSEGDYILCGEKEKDKLKKEGYFCQQIPFTSDETLYEISTIKQNINKEILKNVKEAAIDCNIHRSFGGKDGLNCFSFGTVNSNKFSYNPSISNEEKDNITDINKKQLTFKAVKVNIKDIGDVALNRDTGDVYTLQSYIDKNPIQIGTLKKKKNQETGNEDYVFTRI